MGILQTEYEFTLPRGYVDGNGTLHREGRMRLATAADEILPLRDPRVQQNAEYLTIILFSRVITSLGTLPAVDTKVIERLFVKDMEFIQDFYNKINQMDLPHYNGVCPHCGEDIDIPIDFFGQGQ